MTASDEFSSRWLKSYAPCHTAGVGRHHHQVVRGNAPEGLRQQRRGLKVINRDVEESLYGGRVQVQGYDTVGAGGFQQVGDQFGGNGLPTGRFFLLAGVAEIGNHGRDASGRCASQRVNHDEQLHQVLVHRRGGGLDDEYVRTAHVLVYLHAGFAVRELFESDGPQRLIEARGDSVGQSPVARAGKDLEFAVQCRRLVRPAV